MPWTFARKQVAVVLPDLDYSVQGGGTQQIVVPAGYNTLVVNTCAGAGGGGGGGFVVDLPFVEGLGLSSGGGGGQGGNHWSGPAGSTSVTAGDVVDLTSGAAGTGGLGATVGTSGGDGTAGGTSTVELNSVAIFEATGGDPGLGGTDSDGGEGGIGGFQNLPGGDFSLGQDGDQGSWVGFTLPEYLDGGVGGVNEDNPGGAGGDGGGVAYDDDSQTGTPFDGEDGGDGIISITLKAV